MTLEYRGISLKSGKFIYGMYVPDKFTKRAFILNNNRKGTNLREIMEEINPKTIGMFTNIQTKSDKIYTGDIIAVTICNTPSYIIYIDLLEERKNGITSTTGDFIVTQNLVVGFNRGMFGVSIKESTLRYGEKEFVSLSELIQIAYTDKLKEIYVIGNNVENKDLL